MVFIQILFGTANNYKTKEGELLIGDQLGYYHFFPRDVENAAYPPVVNITGLPGWRKRYRTRSRKYFE